MSFDIRVGYLESLTKLRQRFIRSCSSLEEARTYEVFNKIEELIAALNSRIGQALEPSNCCVPLTQTEVNLVNTLHSQIREL